MVELRLKVQRIGGKVMLEIPPTEAEGLADGQIVEVHLRVARRGSRDIVGKYPAIGSFHRADVGWNG